MNIHDQKTLNVAEAVKQVLAEKKKIKETEYLSQRDQDAHDAHDVDKKDYPAKKKTEAKSDNLAEYDFEEGNEFTAAAAKAKLAGEDEFEFDGKTYPVEIGQDAAEKILGKKESADLEEATMSQGVKTAATQIYSLEKSLKVGSNLNKGINKSLEGKYDADFKKMQKAIGDIISVWEEIERDFSDMNESADLEEESKLDEAIIHLIEDESINIEEMSDEELDEMLEGILKKIGSGIKKVANRLSTSGRAAAATKKADKMDKKAADREKLKKAKERIQNAKKKERMKKNAERAQAKKAAERKAKVRARLANRDEGFAIESDAPEIHEAIKPEDFVKGGDTKATQRDIDKILSKIFINTKLAKQVEDSEAYKAGFKSKGKGTNPYKKDTADFHLYILGQQSAQSE